MSERINVINFSDIEIKTGDEPKGFLKKRWAKDEAGKNILIKVNEEGFNSQDLMELLISEFLKLIEMPCVDVRLGYDKLSRYDDKAKENELVNCCIINSFLEKGDEIYDLAVAYKIATEKNKPKSVLEEIDIIFGIFNNIPNITLEEVHELGVSYINTLLVDIIFDNVDRNLNNIAIVTREADKSVRYERLFDHGISFKNYNNDKMVGHRHMYNVELVMEILRSFYYYLGDIFERINSKLTSENILAILNKKIYDELEPMYKFNFDKGDFDELDPRKYIHDNILENIALMNQYLAAYEMNNLIEDEDATEDTSVGRGM